MSDLSDPVILLTLKKLQPIDLIAVAGTSRRLRALAKDFSLWSDVDIEIPYRLNGDDATEAENIISGYLDNYFCEGTRRLTIRHGKN